MLEKLTIVTSDQVKQIDKRKLVDELRKAFIAFSQKEAVNPPRQVFWVNDNWWGVMSASLPGKGVSVKIVNIIEDNPRRGLPTINGIVVYLDSNTGVPLAIIDAPSLTAYRTAGGSLVSSLALSPPVPKVLAIIGTGFQARVHLEFFKEIHPSITKVKAFDVSRERLNRFMVEAGKLFEIVEAYNDPCSTVREANIILLSTTAKQPVPIGNCLDEPVHVISIGVMGPNYSELDSDTLRKAEIIVVDSFDAVLREVGDIRIPLESGLITESKIVELGSLLAREHHPRRSIKGISVYKSVGIAVQDTVISDLLYQQFSS